MGRMIIFLLLAILVACIGIWYSQYDARKERKKAKEKSLDREFDNY